MILDTSRINTASNRYKFNTAARNQGESTTTT